MSKPRNILVLTYWSVSDALVQAYTLPYLRLMLDALPVGSRIHLVTLEKQEGSARTDPLPGSIEHHAFRYVPFGLKGVMANAVILIALWRLIGKKGIDTIHAWCTPAGAIGYFLSIFTGRPLIIDSYEPHAEAMVENGTWRHGGVAHRIMFALERWQSHRAVHLIAAASEMADYARTRYGRVGGHMFVKPACVDLSKFSQRNVKSTVLLTDLDLDGKLIAVYAGKFGGIYLDQEVFDFFRVARDHWGPRFHVLLLTGHRLEELEPLMRNAGVPKEMFTIRFVQHCEVPALMGLADFALTPVKPVPSKRYCTPIKDGEYWALGLPIVITQGISDDSDIIKEMGVGSVLGGSGREHYLRSVHEIDALLKKFTRKELYSMIRPIAERHRNFADAAVIYREIYGDQG